MLASKDLNTYAMTKHAIEAFTDSLATELAPQGVIVNIVEPGNFNSEIGASATKRTGQQTRLTDRSKYKQPDEVAAAVELALFEPTPKRRYMVTPDQREAEITIRKQIEQLVQLNERQPYSYDRDALVKMLDEALKTSPPGKWGQPPFLGRRVPFCEQIRNVPIFVEGDVGVLLEVVVLAVVDGPEQRPDGAAEKSPGPTTRGHRKCSWSDSAVARRRALSTTPREESDMPSAASHGDTKPSAASGTAARL